MNLAKAMIAALAVVAVAGPAAAEGGRSYSTTPFLPLVQEPAATLHVDPPIPHRLAAGAVLIPYRTENFRVLPIFGEAAVAVSPRAGHLHVTVDDLPWHWADAGANETIVVVGLPPGPHKVLVELALPDHSVIASRTVSFVVPDVGSPHARR